MAKNKKYEKLVKEILDLIGGKENLENFTHCVTRLRFNVKDKDRVREKEVEALEGVMGCQWQGGQYQVIIGPAVKEVYQIICQKADLDTGTAKAKAGEGTQKEQAEQEEKGKKKFSLISVIDVISGCITPALPVLIGAGMLKVIMLLLSLAGVLTESSPTYITLSFVSDTAFYFLPVYVGAASAKKFGSNLWMGMFFGAVLLHPTFTELCAGGDGGSLFGIPIYAGTYSSSIFPALLTVYAASRLEKLIEKIIPAFLKAMLVPLLTILVMMPVELCLLAPIGGYLGNYLADGVIWIYNTTGFIGVSLFSAIIPLMVMTGMHHSLNPYIFQCFATSGYEPLVLVTTFINNIDQGIACLAVALKSKVKNTRSTALSCGITAVICGVTEPAFYGITLKYRRPLYATMIGNFFGGIVAGLFHVVIYAFAGSWGVFGLPAFIGEDLRNLLYMVASILVGAVVTFIATLLLYKDEKEE